MTYKAIGDGQVGAQIISMKSPSTGEVVQINDGSSHKGVDSIASDPKILDVLSNNPLALFPSSMIPYFTSPGANIMETSQRAGKNGNYRILSLPVSPTTMILPSPRYRAFDPIFGAIGSKPVTKSAQALTGSEYTRLAISGGICTVVVRTALKPLELVKTKIQLKNDEPLMQTITKQLSEKEIDKQSVLMEEEVMDQPSLKASKIPHAESSARTSTATLKRVAPAPAPPNKTTKIEEEKDVSIGTMDVAKAMVATRGPLWLFQSADITFLASVIFGSFGFGATELFRRFFTSIFFADASTGGGAEELTVLLAAGLACILTSLAAAPFEILRVCSMGYVEPKEVGEVFSDFVVRYSNEFKEKFIVGHLFI